MKIVVLAGEPVRKGMCLSFPEPWSVRRCGKKGHQAILMDVFFGLKQIPESLFPEEYDVEGAAEEIRSHNDSLAEAVKARREFFGPHVIEICQKADVVFMALHGANGEDGKVQAAFDLFGIPYTGTGYLSSAVAMDKGLTKQFFETHGVPVPKGISLMKNQAFVSLEKSGLEFPVVVKPCCGGSSVGGFIAGNQEEYEAALQAAFAYEDELIVEEYVKGREFSVGVVDGKAYPIIEIAPIEGFYDYTNKYKAGSTIETCPAELTEEQTRQMQEYAVLGAESLGIEGYCRLDFMMRGDGRMYCLEANTLPGDDAYQSAAPGGAGNRN